MLALASAPSTMMKCQGWELQALGESRAVSTSRTMLGEFPLPL